MPKHMRKRGDVWYYWRTVPDDVIWNIGKTHWRFSLSTASLREAEDLRDMWGAKFKSEIDVARSMTGAAKLGTFSPIIAYSDDPEEQQQKYQALGRLYQSPTVRKVYADLKWGIVSSATEAVGRLLTPEELHEVTTAGGVEKFFDQTQIARALFDARGDRGRVPREGRALLQHKRELDLLAWHEQIALKIDLPVRSQPSPSETSASPSLLTALEEFLAKRTRRAATAAKHRLYLRRLVEFAGNVTLSDLNAASVEAFVEAHAEMPNWRSLKRVHHSLTFPELLLLRKNNPALPAFGSANLVKMTDHLRAFFKGVKRDDLREAAKPRVAAEEQDVVEPFSPSELRRVLAEVDAVFGPDSDMAQWCWLLAFSGMRPEEGAQLARSNIVTIAGIPAIDIDARGGRQVKNAASRRTIPVHRKLIDRGFVLFALADGSPGNVFPSFGRATEGRLGNRPSKRLKTLLNRLNIVGKSAANRFRHSYIDACRNAEISEASEYYLVGHSARNRNHDGYGKGKHILILAREIARVDPTADVTI